MNIAKIEEKNTSVVCKVLDFHLPLNRPLNYLFSIFINYPHSLRVIDILFTIYTGTLVNTSEKWAWNDTHHVTWLTSGNYI